MKKTILSIAIAAIFASCANDKSAEQASVITTTVTSDTMGLAQFKEWKDQQELINSDAALQNFTTEGVNEPEPLAEVKPAPVIIYRNAPVKKPRVVKVSRPAKTPAPVSSGSTSTNETTGNSPTVSNDGDVVVSQPEQIPAKKKGWSKAAKGTAIGGASGAVLGAVISKNKTKGAVIGGVVGAAGGYIFGRSQDKKDGRY